MGYETCSHVAIDCTADLRQHIVFLFIADPEVHVNIRLITFGRIRELFGFSMRSLLVSLGDYLASIPILRSLHPC